MKDFSTLLFWYKMDDQNKENGKRHKEDLRKRLRNLGKQKYHQYCIKDELGGMIMKDMKNSYMYLVLQWYTYYVLILASETKLDIS